MYLDYSISTKAMITLVLSTVYYTCEQREPPEVRLGSCCARTVRLLAFCDPDTRTLVCFTPQSSSSGRCWNRHFWSSFFLSAAHKKKKKKKWDPCTVEKLTRRKWRHVWPCQRSTQDERAASTPILSEYYVLRPCSTPNPTTLRFGCMSYIPEHIPGYLSVWQIRRC